MCVSLDLPGLDHCQVHLLMDSHSEGRVIPPSLSPSSPPLQQPSLLTIPPPPPTSPTHHACPDTGLSPPLSLSLFPRRRSLLLLSLSFSPLPLPLLFSPSPPPTLFKINKVLQVQGTPWDPLTKPSIILSARPGLSLSLSATTSPAAVSTSSGLCLHIVLSLSLFTSPPALSASASQAASMLQPDNFPFVLPSETHQPPRA